MLRLKWVLMAILFGIPSVAVAGSAQNWSVSTKDDRFDGKTTYLSSTQAQDGSSLFIAYRHKCDECSRWLRYQITFRLGKKLSCPYEDDAPLGKANYAYVKWIIDDGPIHHQRYQLASSGDAVHFDWRVSSVEKQGYIERYLSVADAYGNTPKDQYYAELKRQRVIPADDMTRILGGGQRLHLRAWDRCGAVDVEVDLSGLASAIAAAKLQP